MSNMAGDIKYSLRQLLRSKVFTLVAVLTLCLGIGCNTAIFSVVYGVLFRPLPFPDANRLVFLSEHTSKFPQLSVSWQNFRDWRTQSTSFEEFGAVRPLTMSLTGMGDPEQIPAEMITGNLLHLLGVNVIAGRGITESDDRTNAPAVALLGYGMWQRKFGASPAVLGTTLTLNGKSYAVLGILPRDYELLQQQPDVVVAMTPWAVTLPDDRSWHPGIFPIARLRPGVSLGAARAEMTGIAKRLLKQYANDNIADDAIVNRMHDQLVSSSRPVLVTLLAAVFFVLLIACGNVANLLLTRATARRREISVRRALGATTWSIVRQLIVEGILLSGLGAAAGIGLAYALMPWLLRHAAGSLPANAHVSINIPVLLFTAVLSFLAGVFFGVAPAGHVRAIDIRSALSDSDRGTVSRHTRAMRQALVIVEVSLALLLLMGAGLFLRTLNRISQVNLGFSADHILIADLPVSPQGPANPAYAVNFYENTLRELRALPGVSSVGASSFLPVSGQGAAIHFNIHGRPPHSSADWVLANYRTVSAGYRDVLHIPLIEGRWITDDDREKTQPVVVINQAMAHVFFPNQDPIGQRMQLGAIPEDDVPWMTIVGVVGDLKQSLVTDTSAEMYVPYRQAYLLLPIQSMSVVLRTSYDPSAVANSLRQAVHRVNPNQPVVKIRTMDDNVAQNIAQPKFRSMLIGIFAVVALLIAAVGIYGVMAYTTQQRSTEMAIRMALGCSTRGIFRLVLGDGMRMIAAGVAIGVVLGLLAAQSVRSMLFGVSAADAVSVVAAIAVVLGAGILASAVPAARAARLPIAKTIREN